MNWILGDTKDNTVSKRATCPTDSMLLALSWGRFSTLNLTFQVRCELGEQRTINHSQPGKTEIDGTVQPKGKEDWIEAM